MTASPQMVETGAPAEVLFVSTAECVPGPDATTFAAPGIVKELKGVPLGSVVLLGDEYAAIANNLAYAQFGDVPGLEKTRENNTHNLQFGQFVLTTEDGDQYSDLVAIKQFQSAQDAAYEMGATLTINGLYNGDRPLSYTPLGFWHEADGTMSLITRYDASVRTQDVIFWNQERPHPTDRQVVQAFTQAAFALGGLQYYGFAHCDAQAKNVGGDHRGVRQVDLTGLKHIDGRTKGDTPEELVHADVSTYLGSLTARTHVDPEAYVRRLDGIFIPRYMSIVQGAQSRVPVAARLSAAEIRSLLV